MKRYWKTQSIIRFNIPFCSVNLLQLLLARGAVSSVSQADFTLGGGRMAPPSPGAVPRGALRTADEERAARLAHRLSFSSRAVFHLMFLENRSTANIYLQLVEHSCV